MKRLNQRQKARILLAVSLLFLVSVALAGHFCRDAAMVTDFSRKNLPPCLRYPFGTDWLGRNMFYRTLTGLSMSILIGVNDVWHEIGDQNGVDTDKYERVYGMYIEEIREQVPDVKIMILEPFLTHGAATDPHWDYFSTEVAERAAAAKRVAQKYGLTFVPLQARFDAACEKQPPEYWTDDGVHPTAFGHELISRAWLEAFETLR